MPFFRAVRAFAGYHQSTVYDIADPGAFVTQGLLQEVADVSAAAGRAAGAGEVYGRPVKAHVGAAGPVHEGQVLVVPEDDPGFAGGLLVTVAGLSDLVGVPGISFPN